MASKPERIEGVHRWITKKSVPGVVLCKWCSQTRGRATMGQACLGPMPKPSCESLPAGGTDGDTRR